jgi:tetratricopeptide (TPR) repeat protein
MVDSAGETARAIPESIEVAPTLLALAEVHLAVGDLARAGEAVEAALAARPTASCAVELYILEARRWWALDQAEAAATWVDRATEAADRLGAPRLIGLARLLAARAAGGDATRAQELFDSALQTFESAGTPYERALALEEYADFVSTQPDQAARGAALREEARSVRAQLSGEEVEPADHGGWIPTKPIRM